MEFPTYEKNGQREHPGAVEIDAPEFDADEKGEKTLEERLVEQQWRDVANSDVAKLHPLSLNRDADQVTTDPYN